MTSSILALDLGSTMGWATYCSHRTNKRITSGTAVFKNSRFEGGGMRFLRFKRWLTEIKSTLGTIDAIYFEEVRRHKGVDSAHIYGGFLAHLTAWCEYHEIAYQGVPVGTIKKHITGKGNASKEEVINAVKNKGFAPVDDNEADSLALLDFVLANSSFYKDKP